MAVSDFKRRIREGFERRKLGLIITDFNGLFSFYYDFRHCTVLQIVKYNLCHVRYVRDDVAVCYDSKSKLIMVFYVMRG